MLEDLAESLPGDADGARLDGQLVAHGADRPERDGGHRRLRLGRVRDGQVPFRLRVPRALHQRLQHLGQRARLRTKEGEDDERGTR